MVVLSPRGRIERAQAVQRLWPDESWTLKRRRFNTAIWRLRNAIRSAGGEPEVELLSDHGSIARRNHDWSDSDAGALAAAAALAAHRANHDLALEDEARMTAAVRGYSGDFLPGAADDWSLVTRESLRTSLVIVLDALARHHRRHGNWARVHALGNRILAVDPALEEAHRMLIESHLAMNDPVAARRQYALCERLLRSALDVAPSEETRRILEAGCPPAHGTADAPAPRRAAISRAMEHLNAASACLGEAMAPPRR